MPISLENAERRKGSFSLLVESLRIDDGESVAIIGPSGSGKTTLLEILAGLDPPDKGRIRSTFRSIGYSFQSPEDQLFSATVLDDVSYSIRTLEESERKRRVRRALGDVGFDESILSSSPFSFSGGEMRRIALAGILVRDLDAIFLDEPFTGLDWKNRSALRGMIRNLSARGCTAVAVMHDMEDALLFDRVIEIGGGRIIADRSMGRHALEKGLTASARLSAALGLEAVDPSSLAEEFSRRLNGKNKQRN